MEELKPCPFCGGRVIFEVKENRSTSHCVGLLFQIECENCGMKLPDRYAVDFSLSEDGEIDILNDRRSEAIKKWNHRN